MNLPQITQWVHRVVTGAGTVLAAVAAGWALVTPGTFGISASDAAAVAAVLAILVAVVNQLRVATEVQP